MAVNNGLAVISWAENLPEDEQPPRHIWWSEELLAKWFKDVKAQRDAKYGRGRRRTSYQEADDVPMSENELAAEYRQSMGSR
jgi:hypothetical protein